MTDKELKFAIKVIKAAKKLGVTSMKLGTLEFVIDKETPRGRPTLKVSKKKLSELDKSNKDNAEYQAAMRELETMNVEDPASYEKAIIENDLIDDDTDNGGEDIEEIRAT
jgi:hypothetical protein